MRRHRPACSRLSAPRSSSSLSRRLLQPGVAHHPRSSAPFGAAAQGEPKLRAAFSRAARQHLAVLALSGAFAARASTIVQCETQPPAGLHRLPIGTVILSYNNQDCKSFLRPDRQRYGTVADFYTARRRAFSASSSAIRSRKPAAAMAISLCVYRSVMCCEQFTSQASMVNRTARSGRAR